MRRPLAFASALVLLLAGLVGCTERDTPADAGAGAAADQLPAAAELLAAAGTELAAVKTARFSIDTEGAVDLLGIRGASGVITSTGDAEGEARLDQGGNVVELSFVIKGQTLHVKGLTGGWQQVPLSLAASVYDPSAMLTPDRGVAHLVRTASGTTEARETVDGAPSYRISGTLNGAALAALVPGVTDDVTGTLWIGVDRPVLHRASFPAPGQSGTVTVTFSDFDAPVTIREP
ncbi:LppX_LprAFG lipoprotein [Solwaraspora sp. WMMD1047]|uniref:LppX_LprAFG lipoprotein n=1 Tax=Solwaraspora sp. WMMD1047 TaxID=3016102 RepID=UPI0024169D8A|nr:LppX_LprAFG lipoprotein [Solwaraspora sp. WMMD1047]MDG4830246.1 LppX_LprAFG lipoprotein [Solwaraspora sp. WMMD1047]